MGVMSFCHAKGGAPKFHQSMTLKEPGRTPPSDALFAGRARKSSKSGTLPTGKIIPYAGKSRARNDWNGPPALPVVPATGRNSEARMYIGLGGLLVLILILWLLGVI
jgi:hypothetical protein